MKFKEYELYYSINNVYSFFEENNFKPRSADWYIFENKRKSLCNFVLKEFGKIVTNIWVHDPPDIPSHERILKAWDDFGKNKEKYKFLINLVKKHGKKCPQQNNCSEVLSFKQVKNLNEQPNINNCIIICNKHHHE